MKVYVAGNPKHSLVKLLEVMGAVEAAGHTISYDWLRRFPPKVEQTRRSIAELDMKGVKEADALVLVDTQAQSWGMYVELGAALALGKKVAILHPGYQQVFYSLPQVHMCVSLPEVLVYLGNKK